MKKFLLFLITCGLFGAQAQHHPALIPDTYNAQYAGGIGWMSAGVGYTFLKNKVESSFLYGFVPQSKGGRLDIVTAKLQFNPIQLPLFSTVKLQPFNPVVFLSYTTNKDFYLFWPKGKYVDDYYWFSSAIRYHAGFSTAINCSLPEGNIFTSFSLYAEWSTNDLYFMSYIENREYLSLWDITSIGLGTRWMIR